ncbi:hypothetical protein [Priestia megaterium]|uniref:hypothetical protein n=1 Tax=Priestia megaterium TaxID=1404 RepID=UPI003879785C
MGNFIKEELENMSIDTYRQQLNVNKSYRDFIIYNMNKRNWKENQMILQGMLQLTPPEEQEILFKISDWITEMIQRDSQSVMDRSSLEIFDTVWNYIKINYPQHLTDDFVINNYVGFTASLAMGCAKDESHRKFLGINKKGIFSKTYY